MAEHHGAIPGAGPTSLALYEKLLTALGSIGPFQEEIKKTSIHLVRKSAFLGVHPRKEHLLLTIKAQKTIRSSRISKAEQVSKSRWHLDLKLTQAEHIDAELLRWIREAYEICA